MFLSSVSHSSTFMKPKEGLWEPLIYSWLVRSTVSTVDSLHLPLASKVGGRGSLGGLSPSSQKSWCHIQVDSIRTELSCQLSSWCWVAYFGGAKKPHVVRMFMALCFTFLLSVSLLLCIHSICITVGSSVYNMQNTIHNTITYFNFMSYYQCVISCN